MSFFEDASLVLIPSAQKLSKIYSVKPTDGTGDLTFTRSNATATRVGPDGLIEKVRTNLILQSNSFSTTWTNTTSTETSGQAGYDGTNDAWLLAKTNFNGRIEQTISASGSLTFSVYAKAGTKNFVFLRVDGTAGQHTSYFDLQNGTTGISALCTPSIEAAGNGYYRCSIAFNDTITIARIYVGDANGDTSGTSGNILIQSAQLEVGDIMTDYIATTTAAVSVGPVANVPRLDYLGSSCPRLLLEPQRTNLNTYSEQLDNAAWTPFRASVTANAATSPDGYSNADKIIDNVDNNSHGVFQSVANTIGQQYSVSVFAKAAERSFLTINITGGPSQGSFFDLSNGTIGSIIPFAPNARRIEDYGNGWYRCSITYTATDGASNISIGTAISDGVLLYAGDGTSGIFVYGCQTELGAYPSSYVNTLGAAVTRGADISQKSSISGLFGATATTFVLDFVKKENAIGWTITGGNGSKLFSLCQFDTLAGRPRVVFDDGVDTASSLAVLSNGPHKIAISYATNDTRVYIDGTLILTDTSCTYYQMDRIGVNATAWTGFSNNTNAFEINQFLMIPAATSNADLAALTA